MEDREIPSWVKTLQWHLLIKGLDPRDILRIFQLPKRTESFAWVKDTVCQYLDDTKTLLAKLDGTIMSMSNHFVFHAFNMSFFQGRFTPMDFMLSRARPIMLY